MVIIDKVIYSRAAKCLITKLHFSPFLKNKLNTSFEDEFRFVSKSSQSGTCYIEMLDGDNIKPQDTGEIVDLILAQKEVRKADPLNFFINVYWFSELNAAEFSELNKLLEQRYCETVPETRNPAYILIDSTNKSVFSLGLIYPYYIIAECLKESIKEDKNVETDDWDGGAAPSIFEYGKSKVLYEDHYKYNSLTHIIAYFYILFIFVIFMSNKWSSIFSFFSGYGINSGFLPNWHDSELISVLANMGALFMILQIVEINYNIRKFLLITILGGFLGGMAVSSYSCFYNWILPSCGALIYINYRAKKEFFRRLHLVFILYAYLTLTVITVFLRDGTLGLASLGGVAAGFFISGVIHFQEEFIDKYKEHGMWVGFGITTVILAFFRFVPEF